MNYRHPEDKCGRNSVIISLRFFISSILPFLYFVRLFLAAELWTHHRNDAGGWVENMELITVLCYRRSSAGSSRNVPCHKILNIWILDASPFARRHQRSWPVMRPNVHGEPTRSIEVVTYWSGDPASCEGPYSPHLNVTRDYNNIGCLHIYRPTLITECFD
jgi:hypothetical protein